MPFHLESLLSQAYGLTLLSQEQPRGFFSDRRVFWIQTGQGPRVVKLYPGGAENRRLLEMFSLVERLQARGYPHVPRFYATQQGTLYLTHGDSLLCLLEAIPHAPLEPDGAGDWWKLGEAAAQLNSIRDEPVAFAIPVEDAIRELAEWDAGWSFQSAYRAMFDRLGPLLESRELGLVHGEINRANAGRRADGSVALLDWDEAGSGPVALELGYPLIVQFLHVDTHFFELEKARAFYQGYRACLPGAWDREAIFAAALFHALRYMVFADVEKRWQRILYAVENKDLLLSCLE